MKEFIKYFAFTKNETKVIIFSISVLFCGFAIKYYKQVLSEGSATYDFSKDDSVFKQRSSKIYGLKSSDTSEKKDDPVRAVNDEDSLLKNETQESGKDKTYFRTEILNINTATAAELIDLPGIGEATAQRIISYREQKKGFRKIEELMNVKGIGKKKFENIKSYIKAE